MGVNFPAFLSLARRAFCEKQPAHNQSHSLQRNQFVMPEQETIERAREDAGEGKSPSTQAGEFVREEMEHIREGKHGARSPQQAIAIGDPKLFFSSLQRRRCPIAPADLRSEVIPNENIALVQPSALLITPGQNFFIGPAFEHALPQVLIIYAKEIA